MKKLMAIALFLLLCVTTSFAQEVKEEAKMVFNPHWFIQVQGGASYTVGEAEFSKQISPAVALFAGYQFYPIFGLRIGASSWEAKGHLVTPAIMYKYKFVQGNLDAMFDLTSLCNKFNPKRIFSLYAFAGIGFNHAFDNDEAVALNDAGYSLKYLWRNSKNLPVGRLGLGTNLRISDHVYFNIEANANILSDKYNSKKAGNADWQFNGLAGFTFKFGKSYKKTEPVYYEPVANPTPIKKEEPKNVVKEEAKSIAKEKTKVMAVEALKENIFFKINSSIVQKNEESKINNLVEYLNKYPNAKVVVTGYADANTGTVEFNKKISQQRANKVADTLKEKGVAADRITVDYKGDTVQVYPTIRENRVVICIAE
ncbi:MAG: OmpA family protein [Bacteroidales bacterium]